MRNSFRIPVIRNGSPFWLIRNDPDVQSAKAMKDVALHGRSLDVDTMTVEIVTPTTPFSFDRTRAVSVLRGGSVVGRWYIGGVEQIGKTRFRLQLKSPLGLLENLGHKGGIYNGMTAGDMIAEICGTVPVSVDSVFASVPLYGWLPYVAPSGANGAQTGTAKDNLLQVLFALNASIRAGVDGTLYVENLPPAAQSIFSADRIYRKGFSVELGEPVSDLTLTEHSYADVAASTATEDREEVFSGVVQSGETRTVVFSQPMSDLQPAAAIVESGANYAVIGAGNWTTGGSGSITAVPYLHVEREISATVTAGATKKTVSVTDATLVSVANSTDVLARLVDYYQHIQKVTFDGSLLYEQPGDVISFFDKLSGTMQSACIEKQTEQFSQILRGTITAVVGFTPWQTAPFTYEVEILTGSGNWTVPSGVKTVTAVIIGGGGGGAAGQDGEDAKRCEQNALNGYGSPVGALFAAYPTYGVGGDGGNGGVPGKILRVTLTVTPGGLIAYACGAGGAGAAYGGDADTRGDDGTHTTFGSNDSADGYADPNGYTDPTSGVTYGGTGATGARGGDGGGYDTEADAFGTPSVPKVGGSVVYNGVTYTPGADGEKSEEVYQGVTYTQDGSFGGGAAAGADGADGIDGNTRRYALSPANRENWFSTPGGNGANAATPTVPIYGRGGAGGNGGGGAGGSGYWCRRRGGYTEIPNQPAPAVGGTGTAGGNGGNGCVILYYRIPG